LNDTRHELSAIFEVAVQLPLLKTYAYLSTDDDAIVPQAGCRVLVPFGSRRITGYLVGQWQRSLP